MTRVARAAALAVGAEIVLAASFGVSGLIGWHGTAYAQQLPVCLLEDGSDVAPEQLPCVWTSPDDGRQWLTFEHYSLPIER